MKLLITLKKAYKKAFFVNTVQASAGIYVQSAMEINKKSLIKCLFFGVILLSGLVPLRQSCLANSEAAQTGTHFEPKNHAFSIYYPASMQPESSAALAQLPVAPELFLKTSGNFPTFNIIQMPTQIEISAQTLHARAEEVIQSYRNLGLLSIELLRANLKAFGDIQGVDLELGYEFRDEMLIARVGLVPGLRSHYILTYIDRELHYIGSKDYGDPLFNTFAVRNVVPSSAQESSFPWLLALCLALIVLFIFFLRALVARRSFGGSS